NACCNLHAGFTPMFCCCVLRSLNRPDKIFFTSAPQMFTAAHAGTMLPLPNNSTTPVYYYSDPHAPAVSGYYPPDSYSVSNAYFSVYTTFNIYGLQLLPLYRLSKLQSAGGGIAV